MERGKVAHESACCAVATGETNNCFGFVCTGGSIKHTQN